MIHSQVQFLPTWNSNRVKEMGGGLVIMWLRQNSSGKVGGELWRLDKSDILKGQKEVSPGLVPYLSTS